MEVLNKRASTAKLDNLHNAVADALASGLDDPKILANAITFLKNNNITAEIMESDKLQSLTDNIKTIANSENEVESLSVEDMIKISEQ